MAGASTTARSSRWLGRVVALAVALGAAGTPSARAADRCGVERWPVKTLTDSGASLVDFHARPTSVRRLRSLARPTHLDQRVAPVETTTYRVRVSLVSMKVEDDSDIHLVVADPRDRAATMIAEFPSPDCTLGASTQARRLMSSARTALLARSGEPGTGSFTALSGTAVRDRGRIL
jgi:hypothetical protein